MKRDTIYLNNAATTWPKPEPVVEAMVWAMRELMAAPGRGGGLAVERAIFEARESLARFIGASDSSRVVFTANATAALNMAISGLLSGSEHVVTTSMDHNSVARPLTRAGDRLDVSVTRVQADASGYVKADDVLRAVTDATRLVILTHASNVVGTIQPVEEVCRRLKEREEAPLVLVDAAQTAGVLPLEVERTGIDLLAVPGHKSLYGPQGTGFLYVAPGVDLDPVYEGGTGGHSTQMRQPEIMPDRLETGTPNTPGIVALGAAVRYMEERGHEAVRAHETALTARLLEGLWEVPGVVVYGPTDAGDTVSAHSFNVEGMDPAEVDAFLSEMHGIRLRVGLHCSPLSHQTVGTFPTGTVRVSPGLFNTPDDIDQLVRGLGELASARAGRR